MALQIEVLNSSVKGKKTKRGAFVYQGRIFRGTTHFPYNKALNMLNAHQRHSLLAYALKNAAPM
jgi:hypothetical protein